MDNKVKKVDYSSVAPSSNTPKTDSSKEPVNCIFENNSQNKTYIDIEANSINKTTIIGTPINPPIHPGLPIEKGHCTENQKGTFNDLVDYYKSGHSAEETYDYLKGEIAKNKNSEENLTQIVNSFLNSAVRSYDYNLNLQPIADSNPEILEKFLNGGEIKGAVCTTIHGFMMETLNECDVPAVVTSGEHNGSGHVTLLYQTKEGEYIWNDYGESTKINADNIISAVKQSYKISPDNSGRGTIMIIGKDSQYYSEFEYKDEAAFGNEIDTADITNSKTAFDSIKEKTPTSLGVSGEATSKGISGKLNINMAEDDANQPYTQKNFEFEYKHSGETDTFDKSSSAGGRFSVIEEQNVGNSSLTTDIQGTIIYTEGKSKTSEGTEKTTTGITGQVALGGIYKHNLYNKDETEINAGIKLFDTANGTVSQSFCVSGSNRTTLEGGFEIKHSNEKLKSNSEISFGGIADLAVMDYAKQNYGLNLGFKANASTMFEYKASDEVSLSAKAEGFYAKTSTSENYGIGGSAQLNYTPESDGPQFFVGVADNIEQKNLKIGLFNEKIKAENVITAYGGVKLAKTLDLISSYSQDLSQDFGKGTFNLSLKFTK